MTLMWKQQYVVYIRYENMSGSGMSVTYVHCTDHQWVLAFLGTHGVWIGWWAHNMEISPLIHEPYFWPKSFTRHQDCKFTYGTTWKFFSSFTCVVPCWKHKENILSHLLVPALSYSLWSQFYLWIATFWILKYLYTFSSAFIVIVLIKPFAVLGDIN